MDLRFWRKAKDPSSDDPISKAAKEMTDAKKNKERKHGIYAAMKSRKLAVKLIKEGDIVLPSKPKKRLQMISTLTGLRPQQCEGLARLETKVEFNLACIKAYQECRDIAAEGKTYEDIGRNLLKHVFGNDELIFMPKEKKDSKKSKASMHAHEQEKADAKAKAKARKEAQEELSKQPGAGTEEQPGTEQASATA